jgi:TRAP-type C4-dicarboxylate transport system permease small subunit
MFVPRARALASLVTNVGAVLGAIVIGLLLDMLPGDRRKRTLTVFVILIFGQALMWGSGIAWQRQWERKEHGGPAQGLQMDWNTGKAPGIFCLLLGYYMVDAAYQGLAYYIMGSITNDSFRLARMTGYYKGVQSAGAAVSYGVDAIHTPYLTEVIVVFAMVMFTFVTTFPVIWVTRCSDEEKENKPEHHVWDLPDATDGHRPSVAVPNSAHNEVERQISRKESADDKSFEHQHRETAV